MSGHFSSLRDLRLRTVLHLCVPKISFSFFSSLLFTLLYFSVSFQKFNGRSSLPLLSLLFPTLTLLLLTGVDTRVAPPFPPYCRRWASFSLPAPGHRRRLSGLLAISNTLLRDLPTLGARSIFGRRLRGSGRGRLYRDRSLAGRRAVSESDEPHDSIGGVHLAVKRHPTRQGG